MCKTNIMDSYNITGVTLAKTPPVTTHQWLQLGDDDPMFLGAKALQERYRLDTNCYKNNVRLAAGYRHMPVVLLQNPYKNHDKDFQDIFTPDSALTWTRNILEEIGLDIEHDVPVFDICPMISDDWARMKARTGQLSELRQAIKDAYDLTAQYLEALQPSTVVVLQCATNPCSVKKHAVLSSVEHPVAQVFCSSMAEAMQKRSRIVRFMQREVRLVPGFHPSRITHETDPATKRLLAATLRDILSAVYVPYAQQINGSANAN
ncbi:hypothetical protein AnigIFM60653_001088 [Aspergillus niger]|nr:hypothetical protein AnigIFM60653_001088 [Aspergillus niger]